MSLILEALRKSEERRRLGESPTLISESAWATRRRYHARAPRRMAQVALLFLLAAALAVGAWWWWRARTGATPSPAPPAAAQPSVAANTPPDVVPGSPPPAPAPRTDTTAPMVQQDTTAEPLSSAPPPAVQPTPLPSAPEDVAAHDAPIDPELKARFERGEVFANSVDQLRTVQPTSETPYVPPEAALPQPLPDPENAPDLSSQPPSATAPASVPPAPSEPDAQQTLTAEPAATPAQTFASATEEGLMLHWQLSAETRTRMPALKLSMHVYADDPAGRFVILDGKRRVEGDPIDQGLRVEAIRRDGVVLSYNGQRFLVARAGQ